MSKLTHDDYREIVRQSIPFLAVCERHGIIKHDQNGTLRLELRSGQMKIIKLEETLADARNYSERNGGQRP